jgi:hypothetical protein
MTFTFEQKRKTGKIGLLNYFKYQRTECFYLSDKSGLLTRSVKYDSFLEHYFGKKY